MQCSVQSSWVLKARGTLFPDIAVKRNTIATFVGRIQACCSYWAKDIRTQISTTVFSQVPVLTTGCTAATCSKRTWTKPSSLGCKSYVLATAPQRSFLPQFHSCKYVWMLPLRPKRCWSAWLIWEMHSFLICISNMLWQRMDHTVSYIQRLKQERFLWPDSFWANTFLYPLLRVHRPKGAVTRPRDSYEWLGWNHENRMCDTKSDVKSYVWPVCPSYSYEALVRVTRS